MSAGTMTMDSSIPQKNKGRDDKILNSLKSVSENIKNNTVASAKIANIINQVKKSQVAYQKTKDTGRVVVNAASNATKSSAIKLNEFSLLLLRWPWLLTFIYILIFHFGDITTILYNGIDGFFSFIETNFDNFIIPNKHFGWYSSVIFFYLIISIFIFIWPSKDFEPKIKLFYKITTFVFIITCILIFWGSITDPSNDWKEDLEIGGNKAQSSWSKTLNNFYCNVGWESKCVEETGTEIETGNDVILKVEFEEKEFNKFERDELKEYYLDFYIQNKGIDLTLDKLECYQDNMKGKLLDSKSLDSKIIKHNERIKVSDLFCDISDVKFSNNKAKIVPVLYYSTKNKANIPILVINLDNYDFSDLDISGIDEKKIKIFEEHESIYGRDFLEATKTDSIVENTFKTNSYPEQVFFYDSSKDKNSYKFEWLMKKDALQTSSTKLLSAKIEEGGILIPSILKYDKLDIKTDEEFSQISTTFTLDSSKMSEVESNLESVQISTILSLYKKGYFEIELYGEDTNNQEDKDTQDSSTGNDYNWESSEGNEDSSTKDDENEDFSNNNNNQNNIENKDINDINSDNTGTETSLIPEDLVKIGENKYTYTTGDLIYEYSKDSYGNWYWKPQTYPCSIPIEESKIKCGSHEAGTADENQLIMIEKLRNLG